VYTGQINASLRLRAEPHDVAGALQLAGALSTDAAAARLQPLRLALQLEGGALPGGRGALNYNGGLAFAEDGALEIAPFTLQGLGVQAAGRGALCATGAAGATGSAGRRFAPIAEALRAALRRGRFASGAHCQSLRCSARCQGGAPLRDWRAL